MVVGTFCQQELISPSRFFQIRTFLWFIEFMDEELFFMLFFVSRCASTETQDETSTTSRRFWITAKFFSPFILLYFFTGKTSFPLIQKSDWVSLVCFVKNNFLFVVAHLKDWISSHALFCGVICYLIWKFYCTLLSSNTQLLPEELVHAIACN